VGGFILGPTVGFTGLRLPEYIFIFKDTLLRRASGASPVEAMLGGLFYQRAVLLSHTLTGDQLRYSWQTA